MSGGLMSKNGESPVGVVHSELDGLAKRSYMHTLSLRLTADQYRQLRRFVTAHEDRTHQRITHQAVLEMALAEYISRNTN